MKKPFFVVMSGSRGRQIGNDSSDLDYFGAYFYKKDILSSRDVPIVDKPSEIIFPFQRGKLDVKFFSFHKFNGMLRRGSFNAVESLYLPNLAENAERVNSVIAKYRDMFVTQQLFFSLRGQITSEIIKSQREILALDASVTCPNPTDYGLEINPATIKLESQISQRMSEWLLPIKDLDAAILEQLSTNIEAYIKTVVQLNSEYKFFAAGASIGANVSQDYLKRLRTFKNAQREYEKVKALTESARHQIVDFGYNPKRMANIILLLQQSIEIMQDGVIHAERGNIDAEFLKKIRRGEFKFADLKEEISARKAKVEELMKNTKFRTLNFQKFENYCSDLFDTLI